jgi:hypothetical protein
MEILYFRTTYYDYILAMYIGSDQIKYFTQIIKIQ